MTPVMQQKGLPKDDFVHKEGFPGITEAGRNPEPDVEGGGGGGGPGLGRGPGPERQVPAVHWWVSRIKTGASSMSAPAKTGARGSEHSASLTAVKPNKVMY